MQTVYVKPRAGGRVRMPDRNFMPMPQTGAWVRRIDYYERLLICGDIVISDPPAETPAADAPPAAEAAPAAGAS